MTINVKIIQLQSFHIVSAHGFGQEPEMIAWRKIFDWADEINLWDKHRASRFFGFNNPNPAPGSPNYGYEQWVTVSEDIEINAELELKKFDGGLYAVMRCKGIHNIPACWEKLFMWREKSKYHSSDHQWLEEMISDPREMADMENLLIDLYLPIKG